jgi:hypothetical protein
VRGVRGVRGDGRKQRGRNKALIYKLGSWIDMSAKGGMDGGWFFKSDMQISHALESSDPGHTSRTVLQWVADHNITDCYEVGRGIFVNTMEGEKKTEVTNRQTWPHLRQDKQKSE